jgi:mRNA interferase ChpB
VNRGDIYLVSLDPTRGREQQGFRPVLVVSPAAFNAATRLPVVLDLDARQGRKVETLPEAILDEVMAKVATIFEAPA